MQNTHPRQAGNIFGHDIRSLLATENSGMARTISSGGRVCFRRQRIVGHRLSIRSGTVESEAMIRRSSDFLSLAKVSRMKRTCRRRFLTTGSRRLRPSTHKTTRTIEISGSIGTRSISQSWTRVSQDSHNAEIATKDILASKR
jgi:hypothetical protein